MMHIKMSNLRLPLMIGLIALLAACGAKAKRNQLLYDGHAFRARADAPRDDRRGFSVTVEPATASLIGAREAGRYVAVKYCMKHFGSSDMDWQAGPDLDDAALTIQDNVLILTGRCVG